LFKVWCCYFLWYMGSW